ncbi:MAG: hypothetical protein V3V08_24955 [Nannocystaceae bacterium]
MTSDSSASGVLRRLNRLGVVLTFAMTATSLASLASGVAPQWPILTSLAALLWTWDSIRRSRNAIAAPLAPIERTLRSAVDGRFSRPRTPRNFGELATLGLAATRVTRRLDELHTELHIATRANVQDREHRARMRQQLLGDLRARVTPCLAMSDLLLRAPIPSDQRGYAECIHIALDDLLRVLGDRGNGATDASTADLQLGSFDLRASVEHVTDFYLARAAAAGRPILLSFGALPDHPVCGDGSRFRQALFGLLRHALSIAVGRVRIEVACNLAHPRWHIDLRVRFAATPDDHALTQTRFDRRTIQREPTLYDPPATSLDLETAYGLLQSLGGRLSLDRSPDDATCMFHVLLPASRRVRTKLARSRVPRPRNLPLVAANDAGQLVAAANDAPRRRPRGEPRSPPRTDVPEATPRGDAERIRLARNPGDAGAA